MKKFKLYGYWSSNFSIIWEKIAYKTDLISNIFSEFSKNNPPLICLDKFFMYQTFLYLGGHFCGWKILKFHLTYEAWKKSSVSFSAAAIFVWPLILCIKNYHGLPKFWNILVMHSPGKFFTWPPVPFCFIKFIT